MGAEPDGLLACPQVVEKGRDESPLTVHRLYQGDLGAGANQIVILGKDLEIAFNAKYFIGVLKLLAGDTVEMSFNKQNEPTIIKETGATFLLLPIRRN